MLSPEIVLTLIFGLLSLFGIVAGYMILKAMRKHQ